MIHPLSDDTLALPSSSAGSRTASNRLPYRPPFLTILEVNSHTGSKPSTTPSEWHGAHSTSGNAS